MNGAFEFSKLRGSCTAVIEHNGKVVSVYVEMDRITQSSREEQEQFQLDLNGEQWLVYGVYPLQVNPSLHEQGLDSRRHLGSWDDDFVESRLGAFMIETIPPKLRLNRIHTTLSKKGFTLKKNTECVITMIHHLISVASPFDFGIDLNYSGLNIHYNKASTQRDRKNQTLYPLKQQTRWSWSDYLTRKCLNTLEELELIEVIKRRRRGNGINLGTRVILKPEFFALFHPPEHINLINDLYHQEIPEDTLATLLERSRVPLSKYIDLSDLQNGGLEQYRHLANEAFFSDAQCKCDLRSELKKEQAWHAQRIASEQSSALDKTVSELCLKQIHRLLKQPAKPKKRELSNTLLS